MRRLVLPLALALALLVPAAQASPRAAKTTLARKLAKALAVPGLAPSQTTALAVDLQTGEILYGQNAARPLAPASVEKLPVM
jgi:D-alanyl-D-alanine carboxypeptidase